MTLGASEQLKHHPVRNYLETWEVFPATNEEHRRHCYRTGSAVAREDCTAFALLERENVQDIR